MNAPSFAKWILVAMPMMFSGCRTGSTVAPIGGTPIPVNRGLNVLRRAAAIFQHPGCIGHAADIPTFGSLNIDRECGFRR